MSPPKACDVRVRTACEYDRHKQSESTRSNMRAGAYASGCCGESVPVNHPNSSLKQLPLSPLISVEADTSIVASAAKSATTCACQVCATCPPDVSARCNQPGAATEGNQNTAKETKPAHCLHNVIRSLHGRAGSGSTGSSRGSGSRGSSRQQRWQWQQ